jgi:hypothetical protein
MWQRITAFFVTSGVSQMPRIVSSLDRLSIPVPMILSHRSGVESLSANGRAIAIRYCTHDLELMAAEAEALGISRGSFIRWVSVYAAQALHLERTGNKKEVTP